MSKWASARTSLRTNRRFSSHRLSRSALIIYFAQLLLPEIADLAGGDPPTLEHQEFETWLGPPRYERRPDHERGLKNDDSGLRNGFRPRHLQTGEGELEIQISQARHTTVPFVSKLFPKWHCKRLFRTRSAQDVGDRRVRQGLVDA
jgi:hypothetical protein